MTLSLRIRVLLVIAAVNAAFFTVAGVVLSDTYGRASDALSRYLAEQLDSGVRANINQGDLNVAPILRYHAWSKLDDAILIKNRYDVRSSGRIVPQGIHLNPLGSAHRDAQFDHQGVLAAIARAMQRESPVEHAGGRAVPISVKKGEIWGGMWIRFRPPVDILGMYESLLYLFFISTLLLTLASFWILRQLVLSPVEQLAHGAQRVQGGDFSVRLAEPERRDEITDLIRSFNAMTETVGGFNKRLEDEVARATEKARQAEAAAMTQRRLAAMGELAAGIAHEINNPLGGLMNAVDRLERGELEQEKRDRYLGLLSRGLERIGNTVNRLRRFTPRDAPRERVDLQRVILDAIELVRHRAERLGVAIETDLAAGEGEATIEGSPDEIGQALLNLLSNALDALEESGSRDPAGPRVEVRLAPEEGGSLVEVRDNGPGVRAEELGRVSDLFYTTKEVGRGTGLGLALVHNTVRAHQGRVEIRSEAGRYFLLRMWLPSVRVGSGGEEPG